LCQTTPRPPSAASSPLLAKGAYNSLTGHRHGKTGEFSQDVFRPAASLCDTCATRSDSLRQRRMRLLVIEDNDQLAEILGKGLRAAGFAVDLLSTAAEAEAALSTTSYATVVLDLGLPDGDGLTVLRELRQRSDPVPVLVLTARGGVTDRVNGLRSGADDYVVKPFAFDELVARIEALLRRPGQLLGRSLELANVMIDTQSRETFVDSKVQSLPPRETAVLELLMRRKGYVVPKKLLEDQIFGIAGELASNAVEVYVHRLRKHLADKGARVKIETVRGVGYAILEAK
jgi:DNA-binding response OmpR family regulator